MALCREPTAFSPTLLLLLVSLGHLTYSARNELPKSCSAVQRFLEAYSLPDLPTKPIPGYNLKVCTSSRSCCNAKAEEKYIQLAKSEIHAELNRLTSYEEFLVRTNALQFQGIFSNLFSKAENEILTMLTLQFPNISEPMEPAVKRFFLEMSGFIGGESVDLQVSIRTLYEVLFAHTYGFYVDPATAVGDSEEARIECLMESWADFDEYFHYNGGGTDGSDQTQYQRYQRDIQTSLSIAKTLRLVLDLEVDVISSVKNLELKRSCRQSITRMLYCSHCSAALIYERPCYNLCYNVISGCMVSLMELDPLWSRHIDKLDWFTSQIQGRANLQNVLSELPGKMESAILLIQNMKKENKVWVAQRCNNPTTATANNQWLSEQKLESQHRHQHEHHHHRSPRQSSFSLSMTQPHFLSGGGIHFSSDITDGSDRHVDMFTKLRYYTSRLNTTRSLFWELPGKLCDPKRTLTRSNSSQNCWNGENHGSYSQAAISGGVSIQRNLNPEVKVPSHIESSVSSLIERLQHTHQLLEGMVEVVRSLNGCHGYLDDDVDCLEISSGEGSQPQDSDFQFKEATTSGCSDETKLGSVNSGSSNQKKSWLNLQCTLLLSYLIYSMVRRLY